MDNRVLYAAMEQSVQHAWRAVPFDVAAFWRCDKDLICLCLAWRDGALQAVDGEPTAPMGALAQAMTAQAPIDADETAAAPEVLASCAGVVLCPLRLDEGLWGVWGIGRCEQPFSPAEHVCLQAIADQMAVIAWSAERIAAANAARVEFVSSVAHELRTPMTAIKGYTDMLITGMAGPLSEAQTRFLRIIKGNADRLGTLIGDLLEVSRLDAGRIRLQLQAVALADVIAETVSALQGQIIQKQLDFGTQLTDALPPVRGDPARLVQILSHLLSNAIRYTPAGGQVRIRASLQSAQDRQWARVDVIDSGIGISAADQPRIFQRFFRADHPLVRDQTGNGLGLSIVKGLVELHGGRVWFESEPGRGTTFSLVLPLATA
mgnify:CR=1 FL=1